MKREFGAATPPTARGWRLVLTLALQQGVAELGGVLLSLQRSQEMFGITGPPVLLHAQLLGHETRW